MPHTIVKAACTGLCLLLVNTTPAFAGSASGRVASIELNNHSNAVLFRLSTTIDKTPKCNQRALFALDLSQIGGRPMYQLLLDAKHYGYVINVTGLNSCSVHVEAEGVKSIEVN